MEFFRGFEKQYPKMGDIDPSAAINVNSIDMYAIRVLQKTMTTIARAVIYELVE